MGDGRNSAEMIFVTGANAFHFANLTMLIASWRRAHPDAPLVVCDYGMTAEQVALLRAIPGVHYAPGPVPNYDHAWEGKARLGSYVEGLALPWRLLAWIDADALILEPLPALAPLMVKPANRIARYLTTRFFKLLVAKDRPGLRRFLAKGFQIERADGTGISGAENYIADLPNVKRFRLSGFHASRSGNVLMARYYSQATESLNQAPITTSKAPRLSTFIWSGKRWRMTSHSNFAALPQ